MIIVRVNLMLGLVLWQYVDVLVRNSWRLMYLVIKHLGDRVRHSGNSSWTAERHKSLCLGQTTE